MTPAVKRGLERAKELLRRYALKAWVHGNSSDALAAAKWISHQQGINERRSKPRK